MPDVEEGRKIAGDQRIDGQKARDPLDFIDVGEPPRDGEQRQVVGEQQHQNHRPDKAGGGHRQQSQRPHEVVGPLVAEARSKDAQRQPETHHDHPGKEHQLQRGGQELRDIKRDGSVGIERRAEVTADQIFDEEPVLDDDVFIEMHFTAELGDLLGGGVGAQRDPCRITRYDPGNGKNQHRHADQNDDRNANSTDKNAGKLGHITP